jgi:UbiD family decarboxylase
MSGAESLEIHYPARHVVPGAHKGRHFSSFREFVDALKSLGEVQEIDTEVDWNLKLGAIIRRSTEIKAAAPLFNRVTGAAAGLRAMGAPAATTRQPGLYMARLALMMGMDPHATALELAEAYVAAKSRPVLSPVVVPRNQAPCKQNTVLGDGRRRAPSACLSE